jgi:hypothetical protein
LTKTKGGDAGEEGSRRARVSSRARSRELLRALPQGRRVAHRSVGERGRGGGASRRQERNGGAGEGRGGAACRRFPHPAASRSGDRRVRFPIGSAFRSRELKFFEISILFFCSPPIGKHTNTYALIHCSRFYSPLCVPGASPPD